MVNNLKNIDLEGVVLGAILLEPEIYHQICDLTHLGLFTVPDYQNTFKVILNLNNEGKQADLMTVSQQMQKSDYFNQRFGLYELTQLTQRVVGTANTSEHIAILNELWMKREVLRVTAETQRAASAYNSDVFDVIDEAEKGISQITNLLVTAKIETSEELYHKALERNQQILDLKGKLLGISSGYRQIDELTGGWQGGKLIVLAGATSMGKTALALNFILNAGLSGYPVGMFSLEMPTMECYNRLQSLVSNIELEKISKFGVSGSELQSFKLACQSLQKAKIYFDDTSDISIFQLKNKARKMKRQYGIEMMVIDYLQLMGGDKKGNREQEVASVSRGLKSLSKELNIPIIALSQLSREIEKRQEKEPKLSDLRESGSLEQDADIVAFVFRPEYYGIFEDDFGNSLKGKAKFLVKKNRGGSWGDVKLDFEARLTKFYSEGMQSIPLQPNYEF